MKRLIFIVLLGVALNSCAAKKASCEAYGANTPNSKGACKSISK